MLNLNSTIDLNIKQFFRWWKRELDFLIPKKINQMINDSQGVIVVIKNNEYFELTYHSAGHEEHLLSVTRADKSVDLKRLYEKDERLSKAKIVLRLTGQDAIQKELSLPAAAKENLTQVVAYELDRYTPFKPDQVYFSVKPTSGIDESGQITVMMILTTCELLDGLYEDVQSIGLSPSYVDYQGSPIDLSDLDERYNLLPERLRQKKANLPRLVHGTLMGLTCLLMLFVFAMPVFFEYQAVNELSEKAADLEKDAKKVKAMQASIDAVIDETNQLIKEKSTSPDLVDMLNTLSSLLKDDTTLSYVQYSEGHLQIQGESPTASALLATLEASEIFVNARFASPVTQDRVSSMERFQITVDLAKSDAKAHE